MTLLKVKDDGGPEEEEEDEDKEFPCHTCVGLACRNATLLKEAEDCKLCWTLTKPDNSTVRGCIGKVSPSRSMHGRWTS